MRGDRAAGNADRTFVLFFVKGNLCRAYLFSNSRNATGAIYTRDIVYNTTSPTIHDEELHLYRVTTTLVDIRYSDRISPAS